MADIEEVWYEVAFSVQYTLRMSVDETRLASDPQRREDQLWNLAEEAYAEGESKWLLDGHEIEAVTRG